MSFLKSLLNGLFGKNHSKTSNTRQNPISMSTPSSVKRPINDNFEKERNRLAELCKMGDVAAMYEMALLWLSIFSDEERTFIENYESNTSPETLDALRKCMDHCTEFEYYTMWIIRAAVYGNPKAKAILDKCSYYKNKAYIPYRYYVGQSTPYPFWSSELFYKAGFCDIIRGMEDCGLIFYKSYGYQKFYYVSDYEPSDEDGFGSETKYSSVFYDEFFREIPVHCDAPHEEVLFGLKKVEAEREAFWTNQENCGSRKYTELLKCPLS